MRYVIFSLLILSFAHCDPCPDGFFQAPNGGDCFKTIKFYDSWANYYTPTSFEEAEEACSNWNSGGLLASIHNFDENEAIQSDAMRTCGVSYATLNIGLKCKGKDCKWDDGSPVIYTNFAGDGPSENDGESCYAIYGNQGEWIRKTCGTQKADCWICRVKARTIDCVDGEIEYKGGCVSIQTSPLDQKSAEESCPGGGHPVSIHSANENKFYVNAAVDAGITGTIYIGGQYSKEMFEWADSTLQGFMKWANGFPNPVFGSCVQILLDSEFGVQGQWTNIDCSTKQPFICYRDGAVYNPADIYPKEGPSCPFGAYYEEKGEYKIGNLYSPNFPLSLQSSQDCTYVLNTVSVTLASINFTTFDCQSGVTLELRDPGDPIDPNTPFITFNSTSPPVIGQYYSSGSKEMEIQFTTDSSPVGTGWAAKYTGIYAGDN
ncbi:hypothetical protein PRIPAC_85071 [Pristionchus pacificus]|uniref:CUB domain-containing protein n=1 Tax=Pristionchus pacificus TaxID=54126 RepID=A0A2A6BTL3_PRIPA|nr:hypothetical protein PRIPAC_85071 [Pristionchus pacificus]|eukprot:PDM69143.1 CUB domain-containing protein [Pristionchus pacificus]